MIDMPYEDLDFSLPDDEEKKPKKQPKTDYNKINDKIKELYSLVDTGSKYHEHMKIKAKANDMLSNNENEYILEQLADEIIDICDNPKTPGLVLSSQLKVVKKIKKLL